MIYSTVSNPETGKSAFELRYAKLDILSGSKAVPWRDALIRALFAHPLLRLNVINRFYTSVDTFVTEKLAAELAKREVEAESLGSGTVPSLDFGTPRHGSPSLLETPTRTLEDAKVKLMYDRIREQEEDFLRSEKGIHALVTEKREQVSRLQKVMEVAIPALTKAITYDFITSGLLAHIIRAETQVEFDKQYLQNNYLWILEKIHRHVLQPNFDVSCSILRAFEDDEEYRRLRWNFPEQDVFDYLDQLDCLLRAQIERGFVSTKNDDRGTFNAYSEAGHIFLICRELKRNLHNNQIWRVNFLHKFFTPAANWESLYVPL